MNRTSLLRNALGCLLASSILFSGAASAAMTLVEVSEQANIFYDPATIKRNGSIVTVWEVVTYKNYVEAKGQHVKSSRVRVAFDCKNELYQTQYNAGMSDRDGEGRAIEVYDYGVTGKWEVIDPASLPYIVFTLACSGKSLPKPLADLNAKFQKYEISESDYIAKRDAYFKTLKQ